MRNLKLFSEEWAQEYMKALNANKNYAAAASNWVGDFVFVYEPSGNLDHEIKIFIGLYKGECTGVKVLKESDEYELLPANSEPRPLKRLG